MPKTGVSVPSVARRARSIVPSPPRAITRSASPLAGGTTSTPAARAHPSARASASLTLSGCPCVNTAIRLTGRGTLAGCGEVDEELTISFRSREAGVGDRLEPPAPLWHQRGDFVEHTAPHFRVSHDPALPHVAAPCLELGLDQCERAPSRRRAGEGRRKRFCKRDEGDVGGHERRPVRKLAALEASHVRPLD